MMKNATKNIFATAKRSQRLQLLMTSRRYFNHSFELRFLFFMTAEIKTNSPVERLKRIQPKNVDVLTV